MSIKKQSVLTIVKKSLECIGKFIVARNRNDITVTCMYQGKAISMILSKNPNKDLLSMHINYVFVSSISHFRFSKRDKRLCQNKLALKFFVNALKKAEVWHYIDKDFLIVNDKNSRSNKTQLKKDLTELLGN